MSTTTKKSKQQATVDIALGKAMLHAPGILGNMHGTQRPVHRSRDASTVRAVVTTWRGRWPSHRHTDADLKPSIDVLSRYEHELAALSPDASRLLLGLRTEWSRRYPQAD